MNDFDYVLEVVNVVPADLLSGTAEDKPRQLRLCCECRDAVMDCASVPATFEVRSAPSHEYFSCALVRDADGSGAYATTDAETAEPLLIGGPHRSVGAVWVHLRATGSVKPGDAAESGRVFVSWRMARVDGQPVIASELPEPSATADAAAQAPGLPALTAAPLTPLGVSVLTGAAVDRQDDTSPDNFNSTHRGNARALDALLLEGSGNSAKPPSEVRGSSGSPLTFTDLGFARGVAAGGKSGHPPTHPSRPVSMLTPRFSLVNAGDGVSLAAASAVAHVSIVLDAEQEASQQMLEGDRSSSRRSPADGSPKSTASGSDTAQRSYKAGVAGSDLSPAPASTQAELEDAVLAQFPHFSVSVTLPDAAAPGEEKAEAAPTSTTDDAGARQKRVDYYATSTQSIGVVPVQTRHQNLYTAPSPVLLDRLKAELALPAPAPVSDVFSVTTVIPSNGLWRERPRQFGVSRWIAGAGSAQEEIQQEHERRRLVASVGAGDSNTDTAAAPATRMLQNGQFAEVRSESALTLLRQQALDGLWRQRVSY